MEIPERKFLFIGVVSTLKYVLKKNWKKIDKKLNTLNSSSYRIWCIGTLLNVTKAFIYLSFYKVFFRYVCVWQTIWFHDFELNHAQLYRLRKWHYHCRIFCFNQFYATLWLYLTSETIVLWTIILSQWKSLRQNALSCHFAKNISDDVTNEKVCLPTT